jgi:hypothetical protein
MDGLGFLGSLCESGDGCEADGWLECEGCVADNGWIVYKDRIDGVGWVDDGTGMIDFLDWVDGAGLDGSGPADGAARADSGSASASGRSGCAADEDTTLTSIDGGEASTDLTAGAAAAGGLSSSCTAAGVGFGFFVFFSICTRSSAIIAEMPSLSLSSSSETSSSSSSPIRLRIARIPDLIIGHFDRICHGTAPQTGHVDGLAALAGFLADADNVVDPFTAVFACARMCAVETGVLVTFEVELCGASGPLADEGTAALMDSSDEICRSAGSAMARAAVVCAKDEPGVAAVFLAETAERAMTGSG